MHRRLLLLLTLTCGLAVGTVYFPQTISPMVVAGLHVSPDLAAVVVAAVQFGYAAGIFLLVPLGDRLPHCPLIVTSPGSAVTMSTGVRLRLSSHSATSLAAKRSAGTVLTGSVNE